MCCHLAGSMAQALPCQPWHLGPTMPAISLRPCHASRVTWGPPCQPHHSGPAMPAMSPGACHAHLFSCFIEVPGAPSLPHRWGMTCTGAASLAWDLQPAFCCIQKPSVRQSLWCHESVVGQHSQAPTVLWIWVCMDCPPPAHSISSQGMMARLGPAGWPHALP